MPQIVKEHFKARPGYANYYFNRLNRDRVWEAWTAQADLAPLGGSWSIAGQLERARTFRLQLDESEASLVLPAGESKWVAAGELGTSLDPPGSGGLLLALHLWRRLAVEGPEKFGEVYYLGTVPSPDRRRLLDVLVGLHGGVECRFLFDPDDGRLLVLEMFPEEDVDPCEIHFTKFERSEGRLLPARIEACFAGEVYAVFNIDDFTFARTTKN